MSHAHLIAWACRAMTLRGADTDELLRVRMGVSEWGAGDLRGGGGVGVAVRAASAAVSLTLHFCPISAFRPSARLGVFRLYMRPPQLFASGCTFTSMSM